jgi:hypothetical protein
MAALEKKNSAVKIGFAFLVGKSISEVDFEMLFLCFMYENCG